MNKLSKNAGSHLQIIVARSVTWSVPRATWPLGFVNPWSNRWWSFVASRWSSSWNWRHSTRCANCKVDWNSWGLGDTFRTTSKETARKWTRYDVATVCGKAKLREMILSVLYLLFLSVSLSVTVCFFLSLFVSWFSCLFCFFIFFAELLILFYFFLLYFFLPFISFFISFLSLFSFPLSVCIS